MFFCVEEGKKFKNTVKYELFIGINMGTFMLNSVLLIIKKKTKKEKLAVELMLCPKVKSY